MSECVHRKPRLNRKFRWQLMHEWLVKTFKPCRVADVGGGKGILTYMLNKAGWQSFVIDPVDQELLSKFTDLNGHTVRIGEDEVIPRVSEPFSEELILEDGKPIVDMIVALHAHGCNMQIVDVCAKYGMGFVLMPCCVIDEPIEKRPGVNWHESLVEYAKSKGLDVKQVELNFAGKNVVIYTRSFLQSSKK